MSTDISEDEYDYQVESLTFKLHTSVDPEKLAALSALFNDQTHDVIFATVGYFLAHVIEESGDSPLLGNKTICALSEGVGRFSHDLAHTMRNRRHAREKSH